MSDFDVFQTLPGLKIIREHPCMNCRELFGCLNADWVPMGELINWIKLWRKESKYTDALEKYPPPVNLVKYLWDIRPKEMQT